MANITNTISGASILGSAENDSIINSAASDVTIQTFGGRDTIRNSALDLANSKVYARVNIDSGDDDDVIEHIGDNYYSGNDYTTINAGAGNDSIDLEDARYSIVDAGDGNDTVTGSMYYSTINLGEGNNYLNGYNSMYDMKIYAGSGNDSIIEAAGIISTGGGRDSIVSSHGRIYSGDGNDTILNSRTKAYVDAGADDDYVVNQNNSDNNNVTIKPGLGNDTVDFDAAYGNARAFNVIQYAVGDGNDQIINFDNTDILHITAGEIDSSSFVNGNYSIKVGNGTVSLQTVFQYYTIENSTIASVEYVPVQVRDSLGQMSVLNYELFNYGSSTVLSGTAKGERLFNGSNNRATINAGDGNDTVYNNYATLTSINTGKGKDTVYNDTSHNVTLKTGADDDYVFNNDSRNALLALEDGNDSIYNCLSYQTTIDGGVGNDSIFGVNSEKLSLAGGKGNDSITNFRGNYTTIDGGDDNDFINNEESKNVSILGGAGDDSILNSQYNDYYNSEKVTVDGGKGNDSISNRGRAAVIFGGDGADSISNSAERATINGGVGDDYIYNEGTSLSADGGEGNDSIHNKGLNATINGGGGDDSIFSNKSSVKIDGGSGKDWIKSVDSGATIDGGDDDDYIEHWSNQISINGGAGNDTIFGQSATITIDGGDGDDFIKDYGGGRTVSISGGAGNDLIVNGNDDLLEAADGEEMSSSDSGGANLTINGGAGADSVVNRNGTGAFIDVGADDDYVYNTGSSVTVDLGAGDNFLINNWFYLDGVYKRADYVSIRAGNGNDYIENWHGNYISIDAGDGDNVINNYRGAYSWIKAGSGSDEIYIDNSYVTVDAGAGNDVIINESGQFLDDPINFGDHASINAGAGDDYIQNGEYSSLTAIDAGDDNDVVVNYADNVTVDGGAGNDTIENNNFWCGIDKLFGADNASINGGDGDDRITDNGSNSTISGGAGNDRIELTGEHSGTTIQYKNGDGNDTVYGFVSTDKLEISGGASETITDGNDLIVKVGSGSITFKDFDNQTPYTHPNSDSDMVLTGTDGDDYIVNHVDNVTIDARGGNDTVISDGGINVSINGGEGNDYLECVGSHNSTVVGGNGNDTMFIGSDGSTISAGAGNDSIQLVLTVDTTVDAGDGDDTVDVSSGWCAGNATVNAKNNVINLGNGNDSIITAGFASTVDGGAGDDTINNTLNKGDQGWKKGDKSSLSGGIGNDLILNYGSDVTINGGAGNDRVSLESIHYGNVIEYAAGDGNDTIYGFNSSDKLKLTGSMSTVTVGNDIVVSVKGGDGSITLKDAADGRLKQKIEALKVGQAIFNTLDNQLIKTGTGRDSIISYGNNVTIQAGGAADTIRVEKCERVLIDSGDGDDSIGQYEVSLLTIRAGAGNDYISSDSEGESAYIDLGAGNDFVSNYGISTTVLGGDGDDGIQYYGWTGSVLGGKGKDTILNWAERSTIDGDDDDDFLANNADGGDPREVMMFGGKGNDYLRNGGIRATLDGGDGNDEITNYGENATISGGAGNDTIYNDADNVTISGGAGNDSIDNVGDNASILGGDGNDFIRLSFRSVTTAGGAGNDIIDLIGYRSQLIEYGTGDGNDTIINFTDDDTLKITSGSISNASVSGTDVVLTIGNGSVLLKNAAARTLNLMNSAGSVTQTVVGNIIRGTENDDTLDVEQSNVIVQPLVGNDLVSLSGSKNLLEYDGGNDTVYGITSDDTIRHNNYWFSRASVNGNDLLFNSYEDTLTLKDVADKSVKMISEDGRTLYYTPALNESVLNDEYLSLVENYFDGVLIDASKTDLGISNVADNVTLKTNGSVDISKGNNIVIQTGDGDNWIHFMNDVFYEDPTSKITNVKISTGGGWDNVEVWGGIESINIDLGDDEDWIHLYNISTATLNGGKGDDYIDIFDSSNVLVLYTPGDGNDTVHGFNGYSENKNARVKIDGAFSTLVSGSDLIVSVGSGSMTLVGAAGQNLDISRLTSDDTLPPGIIYDPKKPSVITVKDPFTGLLDAKDYSEKITLIDASDATKPVILKSGDKSTVIRAGDGGSTMIGGKAADKLYGGNGIDYFTYTLGQGNDVFYDVEPQDVISISGATRDNLVFKDSKNVVTVTFTNDSKSKLTINKINSVDPITFDLDGELFTYGSLPAGVTYDDDNKKTAIKVGEKAANGVEVRAIDIVSTAKTIDGSAANGAVYLVGNDNANIIKAGDKGSTLYGGRSTKAVADKLYGGAGKDVFVWSTLDGSDVIYSLDGSQGDYVLIDGVTELKASDIGVSANKIVVTLKNQKLTLDNPNGEINFLDSDGTVLYTTGVNFPPGVGYNPKKTAITVGSAASNVAPIDLSDPKYLSTVKEIDATAYGGAIDLTGNDLANILRAGSGGSTMNGGLGADKLYGGSGKDVFVYESGGGADVIYGFDGTQGDYILLEGVKEFKASDVKAGATKVDVTIGKGKLTFDNPNGEMNFVDSDGTVIYTMGINFPKGVGYDAKKTAVTVGSDASNVAPIDLSSPKYLSTVKEINATAYGGALEMIGNDNANVIRAGTGGSTMNGGLGADKLYGGAGEDVFVYKSGDGNDVVYGFDGAQGDYVVLEGVTELKASDIKASATKVDVTIGKGKLTFDNPTGEMNFVDSDGTVLYTMGINFPNGMGYDTKKTAVTIGSAASNVDPIDLSSTKYLSTVKEINASEYKGAINIVGNANANILRAGSGGSTLNGSYDTAKKKVTADKLYGGSGKDVFVWDAVWGGADQIYSYSAAAGDIISVTGVDSDVTIDNADFKLSGNKVVMSVGTGKLTVNDLVDSKIVMVAYNDKTFGYATLPAGVGYAESNKSMTIGGAFKGAFDVATQDYLGTVATIDASTSANEIELIGNKKTKAILGGAGKTTVIGSTAADNFYAGTGSDTFVYADGGGKDVIYNFDGSKDVIKLSDTTVAVTDFVEKGNDIVLTVGKGSITFKDALKNSTQSITVEQDGGAVTYKTLPTGVTYKYTASKQTGVVTVKDFSGTLKAAELGLPVTEINAASATNALELRAASNATKIAAGKAGATLIGGDKDDTLIGGAGADVFVSSGGKDLIDKYTAGADKVSIVGTLSTGKANGSNVELTTSDGGTITIKGGVNKELTVINGGSTKTYKFAKTTTNLADALVENASELASNAEDYWFMKSEDALDELSDITAPIAPCVFDEPTVFSRPSFDADRMLTFSRKK